MAHNGLPSKGLSQGYVGIRIGHLIGILSKAYTRAM